MSATRRRYRKKSASKKQKRMRKITMRKLKKKYGGDIKIKTADELKKEFDEMKRIKEETQALRKEEEIIKSEQEKKDTAKYVKEMNKPFDKNSL